jgi:hypothetical protein
MKWSRDRLAQLVRKTVLEQLKIPEPQYQEAARFAKDLGLENLYKLAA